MSQRTHLFALCAAVAAAACSDASQLSAPTDPAARTPTVTNASLFPSRQQYVAIGTSISMGWASNGVFAGSQVVSWPEQLSFAQLRPISLPLIQSPGCISPLIAPLAANKRLSGEPFSGSAVCAPQVSGVTLPTQHVEVAGALTIDALTKTPE